MVISFDRYLSIIHGKVLQKRAVVGLFFIPAIYSHGIYNTLTIIPMQIGTSDMCGPCLKMPSTISPYFEPVVPICLALAILLNMRILWFLYSYKRNKKSMMSSVSYNDREIRDMKHAMIGVMLQACIPMVFNMPQVINLAMYNIKATFRLEIDVWRVINCLNYFSLCLNPCVTLIFVKQFRLAALKFIGKEMPTSSFEPSARTKIAPTVIIISN
uniref:G-protein coupled receptors family 1 profile domain-containing protein n=1 Tax=Panagrolaimus sp. JU765 TaxID=591449 RepID=A0AC34Q087_9BILA